MKMNKPNPAFSVEECKIQASILLKSLHSKDIERSQQAAKRFQRMPEFTDFSVNQIINANIKRKLALHIIALEKGFNTWADLKCQLPFIRGGFLNKWFADYNDAKSHLKSDGGYLLPYKNQYFICDANYITNIGFNPNDPDWRLIEYDWANPTNQSAWKRLYTKWMKIQGGLS